MAEGYTLVICEKPDAARKVSEALSGDGGTSTVVEGMTVHRFARGGEEYVVCSAQGHLYGVSDPFDEMTVYPVFDVEWYTSNLVDQRRTRASKRVAAIKKLAVGATRFVNACDFDVEGETIGYNLLRYACGGREKAALRAKFSTLTEEDLRKAFDGLDSGSGDGLARAGRARHVVDFAWGVNLSRALSQAIRGAEGRFVTVSVGRVQGPTLEFLVQREREIRGFVPLPFWRALGVFQRGGRKIMAGYSHERIGTSSMAETIRKECVGEEAEVAVVRTSHAHVGPPAAFNIGDLQREAYAAFRFAPRRTAGIAEKLYLDALISYPRTGSQKLPPSIGYRRIIQGLGRIPEYSALAAEIMESDPRPAQGAKSDAAHPAIHPTGERPKRRLDAAEYSIFDLVARRFLASFAPAAKRETVNASFSVGRHEFRVSGVRTISEGWLRFYGKYARYRDVEIPNVSQGQKFEVADVILEEKFEQRPPRFTQSSLLERMEAEGIGTKATRADVIATIMQRGYTAPGTMEVSDLGFSVAEVVQRYAPSITSTKLTRDIEQKLEAVEEGRTGAEVLLRETVRSIAALVIRLGSNEKAVGKAIGMTLQGAGPSVLGACPVCKTGQLRVIRSRKTQKRFVGCSNFQSGCGASGPLPQKGTVVATADRCPGCSWPIIHIRGRGRPWRLCTNPKCPVKSR